MQMQMEYGLPGSGTIVDDQPERVGHAELPGHFARGQQQMPQQQLI
ncbi:MAG: hypothetical protein H6R21_3367, partial [Proteobacteria bacterium]|nr:hypothetical protein [Pseudomonadota bacterium]